MKKLEKRKNFIKKHMRNSYQGLGRRKKKQKKQTDINKAFLAHKRMTCGSKVISRKMGLGKERRDDMNHRLTVSLCSHFRARGT